MKINIDWNRFNSDLYRPLVLEEIPDFTPGTIAYDDYWDEQDRRCLEGFKPRPFMPKITNEHYFYLNNCQIELLKPGATRKSSGFPFYRELDRRIKWEIHDAKRGSYGLIVGKPRQVGLSWNGALTSFYELLFYVGNKVGVAAGIQEKSDDFFQKILYLKNNVRKEYQVGMLYNNDRGLKLGYSYRENKQDVEDGLKSELFLETMFQKPSGFEGKTLSLVIFEEAGIFKYLIPGYKATEPCFKTGAIQFGTPIVYGTGGEVDKDSKDYKTMWDNAKSYNLKKVFISSTEYFPGDGIPDEKGKVISFFDFRTGRTNEKEALKYILADRESKKNSEGFVKHVQSYPIKESEIFIRNTGGVLNRAKLNAQKNNLDNCPYLRMKGNLEWETKDPMTLRLISRAKNLKEIDKIHFSRGSKLVFREDNELGRIHKLLDPINTSNLPFNPDIGGIDSYDDEVSSGSGSEGATIIYRCFHGINQPFDIPIAYTMNRGTSDSDDEFYSDSFRLAVWYDNELLLEYTKVLIKAYFADIGGLKHLKRRPDLESKGYKSNSVNEYGFKVSNHHSKALVTKLLRAEVNQNFQNIWFEEILDSLINYGDENADLASAYGMVLVSKLDMFGELTEGIEDEMGYSDELDGLGYWDIVDGKAVFKTYGDNYDDPYSMENISIFDPSIDLSGSEREAYYSYEKETRQRIEKEREDILTKYGEDIMSFTLLEHKKRLEKS